MTRSITQLKSQIKVDEIPPEGKAKKIKKKESQANKQIKNTRKENIKKITEGNLSDP